MMLTFLGKTLNGLTPEANQLYRLIRLLRKEREIIQDITELGLTSSHAIDLLTHDSLVSAQLNPVLDGLYDVSDRREGGGIAWWNNLETDAR